MSDFMAEVFFEAQSHPRVPGLGSAESVRRANNVPLETRGPGNTWPALISPRKARVPSPRSAGLHRLASKPTVPPAFSRTSSLLLICERVVGQRSANCLATRPPPVEDGPLRASNVVYCTRALARYTGVHLQSCTLFRTWYHAGEILSASASHVKVHERLLRIRRSGLLLGTCKRVSPLEQGDYRTCASALAGADGCVG